MTPLKTGIRDLAGRPALRGAAPLSVPSRLMGSGLGGGLARQVLDRHVPPSDGGLYPEAWLVLRQEAEREELRQISEQHLTQLTLRLALSLSQTFLLPEGGKERPAGGDPGLLLRSLNTCLTALERVDRETTRELRFLAGRLPASGGEREEGRGSVHAPAAALQSCVRSRLERLERETRLSERRLYETRRTESRFRETVRTESRVLETKEAERLLREVQTLESRLRETVRTESRVLETKEAERLLREVQTLESRLRETVRSESWVLETKEAERLLREVQTLESRLRETVRAESRVLETKEAERLLREVQTLESRLRETVRSESRVLETKDVERLLREVREKPGRLRWEYLGTHGWESLNVVDETESLRQTGILTMMGSGGFRRAALWGEELYWIRAVDEEGRYQGRESQVQLPQLAGLHMNAVRVRNLDTRPPEFFFIEPEQKNFTCKLRTARVHRAQVWVDEMERLLPAQIAGLEREGRLLPVRDAAGILREAWVRWEEREDFTLSGPEDRHYVLDRNEGVVRFSDGISGRIPPAGRRETIQIRYAAGGGRVGNVDAGAINRSSRALGFVSLVENPRPTSGGCDQETFPQAVVRAAAALRHGDRAVTARDFEALALEATRNIVRAKCFPNRDGEGKRRPGWVTLVALLGEDQAGDDLMPVVRAQVSEYITARCGGNLAAMGRFEVVQPQYLELCVKAELTVGDFNQVFPVREEIERRLAAFLNPLTGNFNGRGWEVGRIPNDTQLRNCLSGVGGVKFLRQVSSTAFAETGFGRTEINPEDLRGWAYALPRNGKHQIIITVESR